MGRGALRRFVSGAQQPHVVSRTLRPDGRVPPLTGQIGLIPQFNSINDAISGARFEVIDEREDELAEVRIVVARAIADRVRARPAGLEVDPRYHLDPTGV